jgi:DNA-3-methyladenine glycosylase II
VTEYVVTVREPYRLDLTVTVLRRFATNIIDVVLPDGHYARALPALVRVRQDRPDALTVVLDGDAGEHPRLLAVVRRMLGVDRDLSAFDHAAAGVSWLAPLAARARGVKPPRYPSLWEACVNAIVFQQISLLAAGSILRRMIIALGQTIEHEGLTLHVFPTAGAVAGASDTVLRGAGLSAGKVATLRRVAEAALDAIELEALPSPEISTRLCQIKGIGPWTAAVILLRGFGRLDVFPANDSGAARSASILQATDLAAAVQVLEPQQGMLYYHLLLARLEARHHLSVGTA